MAKSVDQLAADLADREAIRELPQRYCDCVWRGDVEGIVISQPGGAEHRLATAQRGLDSLIAVGARAGITDLLYCLAVAHEQSGMTEAAERLLDEALTANPDEKAFVPNLLTYRGELRRRCGSSYDGRV